jgi:hypothetical protein
MHTKSKVSKMFGALVLGGGMLVASTNAIADPVENPESTPEEKTSEELVSKKKKSRKKPFKKKKSEGEVLEEKGLELSKNEADPVNIPEEDSQLVLERPEGDCQLEFTLYLYNRDGVEAEKTCLDEKDDEEILSIIKEAKTQTCNTPFCGCWLG